MSTVTVDLTVVAAILVGGALLMIPVLGVTLRLVLPPIVEAVARGREARQLREPARPRPAVSGARAEAVARPADAEPAMTRELITAGS